MKKSIIFSLLFIILLITGSYAQNKKVAVVTFYVNKLIDVSSTGSANATAAFAQLADDPKFNLAPSLKNFHDQFFANYEKSFPAQLLPEEQVINNEAYKDFAPENTRFNDILKGNTYIPVKGYKVILPEKGNANGKNLLNIFDQCDGIMKVYISFDLESKGLGRVALVKVNAHADIVLFNQSGDRVFSVEKDAVSKISGAQVAGIPFVVPGKILPLCESAIDELIIAVQNDLPKIAGKVDRKL